jgi:fructuronate reductase
VLNNIGGDWGICEISLFSGDTLMSQLREQDHLFTVLEKGADGNQPIVIGAVHECLNARLDSLAAIIEKFCEPQVAIVSLTITEKGYCIDPATGKLDPTHPRIIHDLENPTLPQSAPGILVEALARRRERGLPPFTVLSCDNIPDNGHVVKNAVLGMAEKRSPALATGSPTTSASRAPWWIALFPPPPPSRWRKSPPCWGGRSLRHQLRTLHSVGGRR